MLHIVQTSELSLVDLLKVEIVCVSPIGLQAMLIFGRGWGRPAGALARLDFHFEATI